MIENFWGQIENLLSLFVPQPEQKKKIISIIAALFQAYKEPEAFGFYLKPSTAAKYLDCDKRLVLSLIEKGKLKARRLESGQIRIYRSSLDEYIEKLPLAYHNDETTIKMQVDFLIKGGKL